MKPISFLTEEEIQKMQEAEASSSKEQKKTAEQIEAIYTAGQNILVSASAGSGKTFVMAERILDQLARGVEISQLFISTFTVKAATELKERLEKKIIDFVDLLAQTSFILATSSKVFHQTAKFLFILTLVMVFKNLMKNFVL